VLPAHKGLEHYQNRYLGDFQELNQVDLFSELQLFMEHLDLKETIFRSDPASNNVVLKGVLGKDKQRFLNQIQLALEHPNLANLRSDYLRGF
jgi:hypothetical protein